LYEDRIATSFPGLFPFCHWEGGKRPNLVPRAFLVVARELRKTLVKYDEISKILGDLSHAQ
jgi:hypothetical protein